MAQKENNTARKKKKRKGYLFLNHICRYRGTPTLEEKSESVVFVDISPIQSGQKKKEAKHGESESDSLVKALHQAMLLVQSPPHASQLSRVAFGYACSSHNEQAGIGFAIKKMQGLCSNAAGAAYKVSSETLLVTTDDALFQAYL